jgi:predicted SprT family Zn-dependent metalloprotease
MDQAWKCPACQNVVDYRDYDDARLGKTFHCRKCRVLLVIDRTIDQPAIASPPTNDPRR